MAPISYRLADGIATVALERAEAHNAFDRATGEAFVAIMRRAASDPAVRVVVLQAQGPTFSAGGDFNWVLSWPAMAGPESKQAARLMTEVVQCVYDLPKPSIAKVQGACVGGGIGVMLACDYAAASEQARFGLTSVRNGLLAGIAIPVMIQALGARKTRQLLMHGGVMPAAEALRVGLIDRLSPAATIDADVGKLAAELKLGAPSVQALIKRLVTQVDSQANDAHLAPRLLGVDLAAECRQLEVEMGIDDRGDDALTAYAAVVARAYAIPDRLAGSSVADVEALFAGQRVFVERVRHEGGVLEEPTAALRLATGDRVVLSARLELLSGAGNPLHEHEVDDRELLTIPVATVNVVLTRKALANRTLADLAQDLGARGVFLRRLVRAGTELPFTPRTPVERGDVLEIFGAKRNLVRVAGQLGYAEWPGNATDLGSVSLAILLGGLLGLPVITLGRVELGLSLFVGVLLAGLVFGWLRSIYPRFGRIPEPALWVFDSFGLTGFLALVGIEAGPDFVSGVAESGLSLMIAGVTVTTVPHLVTLLVGKHLLKLHPGILIGVCCGAGTSAPALAAVQEVAHSRIPALGYGVGCALGNVVLALWGGVIVLLMSG